MKHKYAISFERFAYAGVCRNEKKKKAELRNSSEKFLCITANMQLLVSVCVCVEEGRRWLWVQGSCSSLGR